MKAKQKKQINFFEGGKNEWEQSAEYRSKASKIINDVTYKYSTALLNEKNWIRRFLIRLRVEIEIRKQIRRLSSPENLHLKNSFSL